MFENNLETRKSITHMVEAYAAAQEKIKQGYALLAAAQAQLNEAFGGHYSDFATVDRYLHGDDIDKAILLKVRKNAWKCIIERLELRKIMSIKRNEDMDKRLEDGTNLPEIALATVFDTLITLTGQADEFAKEAVHEIFEMLRPASVEQGRKYKTNNRNGRYSVGKKVILGYMIDYYRSGSYHVDYSKDDKLTALDRVFHLLDGKGLPGGYRGELVDAINTCGKESKGYGETEYFKFRACLNGNLHIEFKRMDLVQRLNQVAGVPTQLKG